MKPTTPAASHDRFDPLELRFLVLTVIICIMMGGVFPALVTSFGPAVDKGAWIALWLMLASFWIEMPLHRLLLPAAPLVAWMLFYICWGTMAAGYPVFGEGYRLGFRFLSIAAAMAVATGRPDRLRRFANGLQWVLVLNLAITVLLMTRPEYQDSGFFAKLDVTVDTDRFAGMWGDANVAGLVSLVIVAMSRWASRWQARIGQGCGLAIIYLTASRTATWILVFLWVLYMAFAASRKVKFNALLLALVLAVGGLFALKASGASLGSLVAENPIIARVMDVTESKTEAAGGESRLMVLQSWLKLVPGEPWYGYGLFTLHGGQAAETGFRAGFPWIGPHNEFLGIFLDVGGVGLVLFLAVIAAQLDRIRRMRLIPPVRHTLFALALILMVFSNFNHNMLADNVGWIAFSLLFLLPDSSALAGQRLWHAPNLEP